MEPRIRVGALAVRDGRVLLVKHVEGGRQYWLPPGGGLEAHESVFDCARREVMEETGLKFDPQHIAYVRQVVDPRRDRNHVELFVIGKLGRGEPKLVEGGPESAAGYPVVADVRFMSQGELAGLTVWPEQVKDLFWHDLAAGFPESKYLGSEEMRPQ